MKLAVVLMLLIVGVSCGDDADAWKSDRDQLIGTWEGTSTYTRVYDDGRTDTGTEPVSIRLASEGIAVIEGLSFGGGLEWFYQPEPETILIESTGSFTYSGTPAVIDVISSSNDRQVWETSTRGTETVDSTFVFYEDDEVWELTRQ